MKFIKENIWKIVLLLIIIGIILIILGLCLGARSGLYLDFKGVHVIENTEQKITNLDISSFNNINIDVSNANIEFIKSDKYGIDIRYYDTGNSINWNIDDNTLRVEGKQNIKLKILNIDFRFLKGEFEETYIKVYLPTEAQIENVNIENNSGNININELKTKNIEVNAPYGNIKINNLNTENTKIKINSGNITAKDVKSNDIIIYNEYGNINVEDIAANKLYINSNSGDCVLKNCIIDDLYIKDNYGKIIGSNMVSKSTNIDASSGDVKLNGDFIEDTTIYCNYGNILLDLTKEKEYYSTDISTSYGNIVLDGNKIKQKSEQLDNANGKVLKVNASSGNVNINFKSNK